MVQMFGVLMLALGLPEMFESLVEGDHVDNRVMVLGYVVMRVPMSVQWARAARQDPDRRRRRRGVHRHLWRSPRSAGWCSLLADTCVGVMFAWAVVLVLVELSGRSIAERRPRRHALAPPPHRRALRPAGDHHPRRGPARHHRRPAAVIGPDGPGWSIERRSCSACRGRRPDLRDVVDLLRGPERTAAARAPASARSAGATATSRCSAPTVAVGAGLHVAAYYLEHDTQLDAAATAADGRGPAGGRTSRCSSLLYAQLTGSCRPLPRAADRRLGGAGGWRRCRWPRPA